MKKKNHINLNCGLWLPTWGCERVCFKLKKRCIHNTTKICEKRPLFIHINTALHTNTRY